MALTTEPIPTLPEREESWKMGAPETAREKQVLAKNSRLTGAIEGLKETCEALRVTLGPIMSAAEKGEGAGEPPNPELCEHAMFLYNRAVEIENINTDLRGLISRIEI